jgi:predicted acyltransferase (DUF342 family)
LIPFGYFVILLSLIGLTSLSFFWALLEYKRPRDPGPLFINLDRKIKENKEALTLRGDLENNLEEKGWYLVDKDSKPDWLLPYKVLEKIAVLNQREEMQQIWYVKSKLSVPEGIEFDKVLIVNEDFETGKGCSFFEDVYVKGNSKIGERNQLTSITVHGNLIIGEGTQAKKFVDSDGSLIIGNESVISGSITSNSMITVGTNCTLKKIYSPMGFKLGKITENESLFFSGKKLNTNKLSERVLSNPEIDAIIVEKFGKVSVKKLLQEIKDRLNLKIESERLIKMADILGFAEDVSMELTHVQKPEYLNARRVWEQGNETIRVCGNIRIPKNVTVPYNMIVEGDLISECDVRFQGSLNVKGMGIIGSRNILDKSIVCQKDLVLLDDVRVNNCIESEERIFIKNVRVGVDLFGGGIASGKTIYLEGTEGLQKIHSNDEIHIVESIAEEIPQKLKGIIEVIAV